MESKCRDSQLKVGVLGVNCLACSGNVEACRWSGNNDLQGLENKQLWHTTDSTDIFFNTSKVLNFAKVPLLEICTSSRECFSYCLIAHSHFNKTCGTSRGKKKKDPSIFPQPALLWKAVQGSWGGTVSQEWYTSHGRLSLSSSRALSPTWNLRLAAHSGVTAVRHDSAAKLLFIAVLMTCCHSFCWEKGEGWGHFCGKGLKEKD